jgi:hypothetical protein
MIMRRIHCDSETQVYFFLRSNADELRSISLATAAQQKEFWGQKFADVGWQLGRFIDGTETTNNWFLSGDGPDQA